MFCMQSAVLSYVVLFFFFKQKTAYEMRISDWSSDVCSSDLGTPRRSTRTGSLGPPVLAQPRQFREVTPDTDRLQDHRVADHVGEEPEAVAAHPEVLAFEHQPLRAEDETVPQQRQRQHQQGHDPDDVVVAEQSRRSEEQTSELKSIMLIS